MTVDLLPETPEILGFSGRWYRAGAAAAQRRVLSTGRMIRILTAEYLLAFKLDAWNDRGKSEPLKSKDLEDIVALLDGNDVIEERVSSAEPELREAIATAIAEILQDEAIVEVALGQLPVGGDIQRREQRLMARMKRLVAHQRGAGTRSRI